MKSLFSSTDSIITLHFCYLVYQRKKIHEILLKQCVTTGEKSESIIGRLLSDKPSGFSSAFSVAMESQILWDGCSTPKAGREW